MIAFAGIVVTAVISAAQNLYPGMPRSAAVAAASTAAGITILLAAIDLVLTRRVDAMTGSAVDFSGSSTGAVPDRHRRLPGSA